MLGFQPEQSKSMAYILTYIKCLTESRSSDKGYYSLVLI